MAFGDDDEEIQAGVAVALPPKPQQPPAPPRRTRLRPDAAPPWWPLDGAAQLNRLRSPLLRLHQGAAVSAPPAAPQRHPSPTSTEIVDFCRFTEPTAAEAAARTDAVGLIRDVVVSIWPTARLDVFGSFATGLYLPTSDIDAVILDSGCSAPGEGLKALATALARKGAATKVALISKARIPIVKFEAVPSGFAFDVSFDVANGPAAAAWMRDQMASLPPLRPLTLVLKAFLQQRELNEVYSGGVGSYALVVLLVAHLRTHPSGGEEANLGVLLLDFLELYGRQMVAEVAGVGAAGFFPKASKGWTDDRRPELWAIEDPREADNDLGRNSFNARAVRTAFDHAHRLLVAPSQRRAESLLGRVLHLDAALRERPSLATSGAVAAVATAAAAAAAEGGRAEEENAERKRKAKRGARERRKAKKDAAEAAAAAAEAAAAAAAASAAAAAPLDGGEDGELPADAAGPAEPAAAGGGGGGGGGRGGGGGGDDGDSSSSDGSSSGGGGSSSSSSSDDDDGDDGDANGGGVDGAAQSGARRQQGGATPAAGAAAKRPRLAAATEPKPPRVPLFSLDDLPSMPLRTVVKGAGRS